MKIQNSTNDSLFDTPNNIAKINNNTGSTFHLTLSNTDSPSDQNVFSVDFDNAFDTQPTSVVYAEYDNTYYTYVTKGDGIYKAGHHGSVVRTPDNQTIRCACAATPNVTIDDPIMYLMLGNGLYSYDGSGTDGFSNEIAKYTDFTAKQMVMQGDIIWVCSNDTGLRYIDMSADEPKFVGVGGESKPQFLATAGGYTFLASKSKVYQISIDSEGKYQKPVVLTIPDEWGSLAGMAGIGVSSGGDTYYNLYFREVGDDNGGNLYQYAFWIAADGTPTFDDYQTFGSTVGEAYSNTTIGNLYSGNGYLFGQEMTSGNKPWRVVQYNPVVDVPLYIGTSDSGADSNNNYMLPNGSFVIGEEEDNAINLAMPNPGSSVAQKVYCTQVSSSNPPTSGYDFDKAFYSEETGDLISIENTLPSGEAASALKLKIEADGGGYVIGTIDMDPIPVRHLAEAIS